MKFDSFDELADDTICRLIDFGLKSKSVKGCASSSRGPLKQLMDSSNVVFDYSKAQIWLRENYPDQPDVSTHSRYTEYAKVRRFIWLLSLNYDGKLSSYPGSLKFNPGCTDRIKSMELKELLENYRQFLINELYAPATIDFKVRCAAQFLLFLESRQITQIQKISINDLTDYLSSERFQGRNPGGVRAEELRLFHFFCFLNDLELLNDQRILFYDIGRPIPQEKIITTLSPDSEKIWLSDSPYAKTNLRHRAMSLLGLRCGLRRNDIKYLTYGNINFKDGFISLVQNKTNVSHTVPMDIETSNAILEYILTERPDEECPVIFLTSKAPYQPLAECGHTSSMIWFRDAEPDIIPASFGFHILRRTYASRLLEEGTDLPVISSALGHTDKRAVQVYLSTDETRMSRCALEITDIPYEGGLF